VIHPTAIVEEGAIVGQGTDVWDNVHIRRGAVVGERCIIGEKTYIAPEASIGNLCKLNANVYVCSWVTIEDGVMIAAHTVFTNDRYPRATDPEIRELRSSAIDEHTLPTRVRRGATIGANCTIGPDLTIGAFAVVGMGAVVTRDVPDHALVVGNPARAIGLVCRCGEPVARGELSALADGEGACAACARPFALRAGRFVDAVPDGV
jgi:UDP-2-acetamido-3-amino-2,3-dideoxy-glucuronate N-acetyltransferase